MPDPHMRTFEDYLFIFDCEIVLRKRRPVNNHQDVTQLCMRYERAIPSRILRLQRAAGTRGRDCGYRVSARR